MPLTKINDQRLTLQLLRMGFVKYLQHFIFI